MGHPDLGQYQLNASLTWAGFKQLVPIAVFVTAFGAAFGLEAVQTGVHNPSVVTMSALVFAGAAQFAVLELWGHEMSLMTLAATVFAINARHLLMGATLYPWLRHLPPAPRYGVMLVVSDANWALSMQAFRGGQPGLGVLLGGGIALWLSWVVGTGVGAYFGSLIHEPKQWGLDMVMGCFLLAMVVGSEKNVRVLAIWTVAAGASLLAYAYLPENTHVIAGALAGGVFGVYWGKPHGN